MFQSQEKKPATKGPEAAGWYSLPEMAALFGMTPQGFAKIVRPLLDPKDVRGEGRKGVQVRGRAAIDAYVGAKVKKAEEAAAARADPMLAGADDPSGGLSRFRLARAEQEELNLAVMKRELVNFKEFQRNREMFLSALRTMATRLGSRFGNDAIDLYNAGIDEAARYVEELNKQMNRSENGHE